ncbi:MAG: MMPL family transporter [Planctomycetes bacterium]|nr:MMPL family transporter [Planctomycetota bacterium]
MASKLVESVPLTKLLSTPKPGAEDPYEIYRGLLFDDPRAWKEDPYEKTISKENRTLLVIAEIDATTNEQLSPKDQQLELDERRRTAIKDLYKVIDKYTTPAVLKRYGLKEKDITIHKGGGVVIQHELEQIARSTVITLVPAALALSLIALGLGFRSWHALLIVIVGGGWATIVVLGGVVIGGWTLNVVTVCGPILMFVIIVATTVHFAQFYSTHVDSDSDDDGKPKKHAAMFVRWVAVPCIGAATTTGIGFLMLTFNELGPIRELGVELFVGSILSFFGAYLVWLLLPRLKVARGVLLSGNQMLRLGIVVMRRPAITVLLFIPVLVLLAMQWRQVKVDVDPFSFFEEDSYVATGLEHFSSREFGHYTLDVILVPRNQPKDAAARDAARKEDSRIAVMLEKSIEKTHKEVRKVISAPSIIKRIDNFTEQARDAVLQGDLEAARANLARGVMLGQMLKNWLVDLSDQGTIRITFLVNDQGEGFRPILNHIRSQIEKLPGDRFDHFFTGTANSVAVLSEQLVGAMTRGLLAALAAMAILCVVLFRSLRLTLIAVLPNAFPILVVFGVMGIFGIPLNSGSAMVATIALGVGLNDTVHFVMHYRRCRMDGADTETALRNTFEEIARPMVLTSVVNCAGFAIFMLAKFQPMYHFGIMASIAMMAALLGDLLLLPNLLRILDRRSYPPAKTD